MYRFLCVLVCCFTLITTTAQDCSYKLQGVVQDFHDGELLELAQVYITPLQRTVSTDAQGTFEINGLCAGTYKLRVSHVSCEPKTLDVTIDADKKITVKLEHHVEELNDVKVLADVHDDHDSTTATQQVATATIEINSAATLGDALSSVKGVTTLKTGNSVTKPIIHGLYGSRVAIVNDGLRQQDQEWGVEHAPNIDLNAADNIQVIKGASALRYGGDAVGGTILINPRRILAKDTLVGKAILSGQSNGRGGAATASFSNFNKSGWYQQGTITAKRLGDYEAPGYVLSNTGSETYAANFSGGFKKFDYSFEAGYSYYQANIGILRTSHVGNVADLVRSINAREPLIIRDFTYDIDAPRQEVFHHALRLKGFKRFSELGKLSVDYGLQFNNRFEYDIRRTTDAPSLDIDLLTQNLAAHLKIDRFSNLTIETGIDAQYQINTPDVRSTGVRRLIPDYTSYRAGAFLSGLFKKGDHWIIDAGLRYDYYNIDAQKFYFNTRWEGLGYDEQYPQFEVRPDGASKILTNPVFDFHLFAFTAGAKYVLDSHQDLAINLSTANRAPNPSELFSDGLHHALATIELGRLDLEKEQSYKLNTVYHLNEGKFDFEINPYFNFIQNFVQLEPTGVELTTRGAFPVYQYRQTDARLFGVDAGASYTFDKFVAVDEESPYPSNDGEIAGKVRPSLTLAADFSYIHGTDLDLDRPLIDMPPAQFNLNATYYDLFIEDLDFDLSVQNVWEQQRFPDLDYPARTLNDDGTISEVIVEVSQPPPAYMLWNVGVSYAFAKARIRLSAQNLFNTEYRNYLNRQRFYADDIGRNIQLQFIYNL